MLICLLVVDVENPFEETLAFTSILFGSFATSVIVALPFVSVTDTSFCTSAPCTSQTTLIPLNGILAYVAVSVKSNDVFGSTKSFDVIITVGVTLDTSKLNFDRGKSVANVAISIFPSLIDSASKIV